MTFTQFNFQSYFQIIFFINTFFISGTCISQTTIKGKIDFDNNEQNLTSTILLKEGENTIEYTFSNSDNTYIINTNRIGKFTLTYSSLNYETKSIEIEIKKTTKEIEKNVTLVYKSIELNEVIISNESDVKIKNDTIIFRAKSFLQGNEQVVEDLLKKIPGLNVSSDGTIKLGNQEIEKVMIDGDDMFEKGYKLLTKNMPVKPIDKVELYQHYSNNKHLKGIEDSEKVALNLTLKQDAKRVWFGNLLMGYGLVSENRYEVRGNLMNFGKKNKYYFITNLNNVGEDATGDINNLIRPYRFDEPASIGDDQSANTLLGLGTDLPYLKQKRVNLNNAEMLSLNSIFTLSEKVKLKTLGFINTDENNYLRNSFQSFSVGTTNFQNIEDLKAKKTQITGFGKIDLIYDISKNKTLEYSGKINNLNEKKVSDLSFNDNLLNEKLESYNQLFDQKLVFTNKFRENKVFLLSGRYIYEKTPQNYTVNQFYFNDLFTVNANNTKQYSQDKMQFAGFEGHLLNKLKNDDLIELKFGSQLRIDNLKTKFELLDNNNSIEVPINYQNNLSYTTNNLYASAKYHFKFGKFKLSTQSNFHKIFNELENYNKKNNQNTLYILPKIGLDWDINKKNKVITSYTYNTTNIGVLDIYSGFVQTGFRSFSKGLGEFNQLNASNAILNYNYGNWSDNFFANSFILYSKSNDFISTNSFVSQNYSQSNKIIIKNSDLLTFSLNIDRYFKILSTNFKLVFGGSKSNFKNIVNNSELREVNNKSFTYAIEIRSGFSGIFNYHIGSKWKNNEITTTINNSFTDNTSFIDLSFIVNSKLNFQLQTERYFFGNLNKNSNKYYFMDLEARYIMKENKVTFFLSGNNLFNTKTFRNYSVSDISVSMTEYQLQPRYVLLKMEYRF